jgi:hypothetical protein
MYASGDKNDGQLADQNMVVQFTIAKMGSLIIALIYVVSCAIATKGSINDIALLCLMLTIPLGLIWFPDELGSVAPYRKGGKWTTQGGTYSESPGILVAAMGWFFLVGMPLLIYLLSY